MRQVKASFAMGTLKDRYIEVRTHTEDICEPLETEDYVVQPTPDVSPPKWHLAHTTWFWEEFVLATHAPGYRYFHSDYSFLFNSYYHHAGDRLPRIDRGNMSRPTVGEIKDYRAHVDENMIRFLEMADDQMTQLIETGLNHEQQHQELLYTDIKYILGHNPLSPPYKKDFMETTRFDTDHGFADMEMNKYPIGYRGIGFSFDNEHASHCVFLQPFSIRKSLVTNIEYQEFIAEGGYENPLLWHSDGWDWVQTNQISKPLYWHSKDDVWHCYTLAGLKAIDKDEPVTHISFYEAAAFAEWKGMRLPTEFEWEAASDKFSWGQRWEHCNSAYLPYPGYVKPSGAIGEYNGKFMVNQMVLRGASAVTPDGHSRKTYRNFFYPQQRWQFNGIRLCKKNET